MEKRASWLLGILLLASVVVAFLPALRAGFIWNDNTYVTENLTLDGTSGLHRIWTEPESNEQYYPLVFTSYWVEKRLWGLHPLGYHLVNVLLHAGAALLLWRFLLRLDLKGAWLAAAAFALHPVCVESVAWVTERKNTLSLVLSLLSAHAWLSWRAAREAEGDAVRGEAGPKRRKKEVAEVPWYGRPTPLYVAALACLGLALLAKTTASVLPAVFLVLVWWQRGRLRWSDVRPLLPFFAVGIGLAVHTAWFERTMVQATGGEWALGPTGRIVLAGRVVAFYAAKLVWPADLTFIYPRWEVDPRVLSQWLPLAAGLAVLGACLVLARRDRRGPLTALLLFGGVLFPAMGFFNVYAMRYSYVADHFAYQAVAIGVSSLVCGAAGALARTGIAVRRGAAALAVGILGVFGALTFRQCREYEGLETLWKATLAKNPGCFMCHTNYGFWLFEAGRTDEAVQHFEASLRIKPDGVPTLLNLARIEEERGRFEDAARHLREALRLEPKLTEARVHLGNVYTKSGKAADALAEYREVLRLGSDQDFLAYNGLGVALMQLGRNAEAIEQFRMVVRLRPDYDRGRDNLERALGLTGQR